MGRLRPPSGWKVHVSEVSGGVPQSLTCLTGAWPAPSGGQPIGRILTGCVKIRLIDIYCDRLHPTSFSQRDRVGRGEIDPASLGAVHPIRF